MADVIERVESREYSSGQITRRYRITGTDSDTTAMTALLAEAPTTYQGYIRQPDPTMDAIWVDTVAGEGEWDAEVLYARPAPDIEPPDINTVTVTGDTAGGMVHLTNSIATSGSYVAAGDAPDYKTAIGVTPDGVNGVDVVAPVFNFSVMKVFSSGSLPDLGDLYALTGKTNNAEFTVTDSESGLSITLATGECLFRGGSFGRQRTDGGIEFTYQFSASPNKTGLSVGDITAIAKKGWEYLWVRYDDREDATAKALVKQPTAVYIEQVYFSGDFGDLGL